MEKNEYSFYNSENRFLDELCVCFLRDFDGLCEDDQFRQDISSGKLWKNLLTMLNTHLHIRKNRGFERELKMLLWKIHFG